MKAWMNAKKGIVVLLGGLVLVFACYGLVKAQRGLKPVQSETQRVAPPVDGLIGIARSLPAVSSDSVSPETVAEWLSLLRANNDGSAVFAKGIANLEQVLWEMQPVARPRLLANYPNPFNPETWIPYQLAVSAAVEVSIYALDGRLVRTLALGHQAAGRYESKARAAYWDGRNEHGERVASGIYFYTLRAGDFSATQKMLIRK